MMKKKDILYFNAQELKAKEIPKDQILKSLPDISETDIMKLFHELEVYQLELKAQNEEIKTRAEELILANNELKFQNSEKEKRAEELIIANKELAFQNKEKVRHAENLILANKELAFQNSEKENRAEELIIANKELAFQNKEKVRHAEELIQTNKELQLLLQLNSDKDQFMAIVSHDLKSPFNAILGFLDLLEKNIRSYDIDKIEHHVHVITHSANNFYNLLEGILLWSRAQSGKISYEPQSLVLKDLCREVIENMVLHARSKNISISQSCDEKLEVVADPEMIKTVLRNLVSNAIKFTGQNGRIEICAKRDLSNITISVSDNGTGMSPDKVKELFNISRSQSTSGTANETGTGLGLLLCRDFILKHEGEISIESEVGKGSVFSITLPVKSSF
jgi:signal transduction histidine kinase